MTKLEKEMLNYYNRSLELYEARLEVLKKPYKKSEVQLMSAERDLVRKKIKEFKLKIGELEGTLEGS
jgi:hypothetical protein